MTKERNILARHVAGHLYAAMAFEFQVFRLTIEEFSEAIFSEARGKFWIDEWTILEPRETRSPGSLEHTMCMDHLTAVSLCGPAAELNFRGEPCTAESIQQFAWDWQRASDALRHVWPDDEDRSRMLEQHAERVAIFVGHAPTVELIEAFASHLVEHGSMSAAESKAIWKRVHAEQEARQWGPPSAIPEDEVHEEWIDVSVDPE